VPRPKVDLGLTPAKIIAKMTEAADGNKVRALRRKAAQQAKQVLPEARTASVGGPGIGGIFKSPPGDDAERPGSGKQEAVSDVEGNPNGENFKTQLSRVLKRMLGEAPPPALIREAELVGVTTNAEFLAAVIQREAFTGKQWACEYWRDMAEGKPVRAAQQNNSDQEVEESLDRLSLAALNRLAEKGS
jgi:hypothetical protein